MAWARGPSDCRIQFRAVDGGYPAIGGNGVRSVQLPEGFATARLSLALFEAGAVVDAEG